MFTLEVFVCLSVWTFWNEKTLSIDWPTSSAYSNGDIARLCPSAHWLPPASLLWRRWSSSCRIRSPPSWRLHPSSGWRPGYHGDGTGAGTGRSRSLHRQHQHARHGSRGRRGEGGAERGEGGPTESSSTERSPPSTTWLRCRPAGILRQPAAPLQRSVPQANVSSPEARATSKCSSL